MDIGAKLFYKCQFDIELANPDQEDDILWLIMMDLGRWTMHKRYGLFKDPRKLTYAKNGTNLREGDMSFRSALHEDDERLEWAGVLKEERRNLETVPGTKMLYSPRTWTTELSYTASETQRHAHGVFSLILSYQDSPGFLGLDRPTPPPSVPKLVEYLTGDDRLLCSKAGFGLESMVTKISDSNGSGTLTASALWSLVTKAEREYPIVYVAYDWGAGRPVIEPEELAASLYPNALICYTDNPGDDEAARQACPIPDLCCLRGSIRVYASHPAFTGPDVAKDLKRHRYFSAADIALLRKIYGSEGIDPMAKILRKALSQDVHFYETKDFVSLDKVYRDKREAEYRKEIAEADNRISAYHAKLKELRAEVESARKTERETLATQSAYSTEEWKRQLAAKDKTIDETMELAESYSNELGAVKIELADTKGELTDTKRKVFDLTVTLDALYKGSSSSADLDAVRAALPADLPDLFSATGDVSKIDGSILKLFEELYPDRILIADRAWEELKDCVTKPSLFWQAMWMTCTVLWDAYSQQGTGHPEEKVQNHPDRIGGFSLALSEGAMTRKDKKLMALRKLSFNGKEYDIESHLKSGTNDNDGSSVRMYFAWDEDERRIVIGHIGKHLLNWTGKNMGLR